MTIKRELTAIMFADIQGYTAVMEQDETRAIAILEKFQHHLTDQIEAHNGRIIQLSGDGALCIFKSAIETIHAAIAIQMQMREGPKVPLRIGIHTGDIITEGNNVYGDGVNIASRIESFAVPGSILISKRVYDDIKNQNDIKTVSLGSFELKNIKIPVEIFAISNPGLIVPEKNKLEGKGKRGSEGKIQMTRILLSVAAIAVLVVVITLFRDKFRIPEKSDPGKLKIIAVLPFANLSPSRDDEYFADGMCDEILTQISKIGGLNAISRTSTLQFRDTKKTIREIGEQLGADVLLEGSVQKSFDKVRINVQLIDAKDDSHLWAETYDRELKDVFAIQTDIARNIASALNTTLTEKEKLLFDDKPTDNTAAYDFYLRGNKASSSFWDYSKMGEGPQAIRMYEQAIKLDPQFTSPYFALIELHCGIYWKKLVLNSDDYRTKAKQWLDKMLLLNIDDANTHNALAIYKYQAERDYEGSLAELNVVDNIVGNGKSTYALRADILIRMGKFDEALVYLKKRAELFPKSGRLLTEIAETYKLKRDFDSSLLYINKAIETSPDVAGFYMVKSMYYAELKGDLETAYAILKNAHELVDTNDFTSAFVYFDILKGKYDNAIKRTAESRDSLGILWQYKLVPNDLSIALMYQVQGNEKKAKFHFQRSAGLLSAILPQHPDDFRMHAAFGISLAGLGEKENALMEGKLARELMPVSKDVILGISSLESLALIYTLLGEEEEAVDILQQLLVMPFGWTMSNTIPLYKMHYYWKSLKNNKRFQDMITKMK